DTRRPALVLRRVHADAGRHEADAVRLAGLHPDFAVAEGLHRRHGVGTARRTPGFFRLGIARDADVDRDPVVPRREILVRDRPVEAAAVLALHLEVVRQQAREVGEVVQRRPAHAPAGLIAVAEGILALEQERRAGGLDAPAPEIRADEVAELPVGT